MTAPIAAAEHAPARRFTIRNGRPHPLGATPDAEGTNFALFSRHATSVELLIFERHDSPKPVKTIKLDPSVNRTFYFWHVYVNGVTPGMGYAYRVDGPQDLHGAGHRFNPNKVLIDPYGRGTTSTLWDRVAACGPDDNLGQVAAQRRHRHDRLRLGGRPAARPVDAGHGHLRDARARLHQVADLGRAVPRDLPRGHRQDPLPPEAGRHRGRAAAGLRVRRGRDQRDQPARPGSSSSTTGATARSASSTRTRATASRPTRAATSASSGTWSRPSTRPASRSSSTSSSTTPAKATTRARRSASAASTTPSTTTSSPTTSSSTRTCRAAGTRSTATSRWSRSSSPSACSSGSARCTSTASASTSPRSCRAARTATRWTIRRSLWHIELDNELSDTKIIAEAWDAGGLYQVGYFPGFRWAEWNGRFRDDVRRFVKGDKGIVGKVAARIAGSADIYQADGELPINSINFITAHDGFTLNDLVSYNGKHNEANGEGNRDGTDDNLSWNHGVEGDDGRPRDRGPARPPGPQLPDDPDALPGRADDGHGRRGRGRRSSATTTPTARTTRSPGSTGSAPRSTPT